MATTLLDLNYTLVNNNRWGQLRDNCVIQTGITGYTAALCQETKEGTFVNAELRANGELRVYVMTQWNLGSGPAVNTPEMVRASLPHDMFCLFTDYGLLPWSVRALADGLFSRHVKEFSPPTKWYNPFRYHYVWRWVGVRAYSKFVAYWKKEEFVA